MVVDNTTRKTTEYELSRPEAGMTSPGEYAPAGENQGESNAFSARQVAHAFDIDVERVHKAMKGEFGLAPDALVDSRQTQQLAEVLLTDRSIELRQAALMNLGAFTPRVDHEWGIGEGDPAEESDRLVRRGNQNDEERGPMKGWVKDDDGD